MKERGILFSDEMVRAILDGRKTQTRRAVKRAPSGVHACHWSGSYWALRDEGGGCTCKRIACPYGWVGDRLWVREAWQHGDSPSRPMIYRATDIDRVPVGMKWKPGIHLHRANARITLEVTEVRAQRLHDISDEDARAEGVPRHDGSVRAGENHRAEYACLWNRINGEGAYEANPWVWAITFKRVEPS